MVLLAIGLSSPEEQIQQGCYPVFKIMTCKESQQFVDVSGSTGMTTQLHSENHA
jgi:hypothetical protein